MIPRSGCRCHRCTWWAPAGDPATAGRSRRGGRSRSGRPGRPGPVSHPGRRSRPVATHDREPGSTSTRREGPTPCRAPRRGAGGGPAGSDGGRVAGRAVRRHAAVGEPRTRPPPGDERTRGRRRRGGQLPSGLPGHAARRRADAAARQHDDAGGHAPGEDPWRIDRMVWPLLAVFDDLATARTLPVVTELPDGRHGSPACVPSPTSSTATTSTDWTWSVRGRTPGVATGAGRRFGRPTGRPRDLQADPLAPPAGRIGTPSPPACWRRGRPRGRGAASTSTTNPPPASSSSGSRRCPDRTSCRSWRPWPGGGPCTCSSWRRTSSTPPLSSPPAGPGGRAPPPAIGGPDGGGGPPPVAALLGAPGPRVGTADGRRGRPRRDRCRGRGRSEPTTLPGGSRRRSANDAHDAPSPLDTHDRSVQFHACFGAKRQVQVRARRHPPPPPGRDRRTHRGRRARGLSGPRAVRPPRRGRVRPGRRTTGGAAGAGDGPPALRYRIADRSLRSTNPVLGATTAYSTWSPVTSSSPRCSTSVPAPVRARFGLDYDDLAVLSEWSTESARALGPRSRGPCRIRRARVGRAQHVAGRVDRLLLGSAASDGALKLSVGGWPPSASTAATSRCSACSRSNSAPGDPGRTRRAGRSGPIGGWVDLLRAACHDLLAVGRPRPAGSSTRSNGSSSRWWTTPPSRGVARTCPSTYSTCADSSNVGLDSGPGRPDYFRGGVMVTSMALTPVGAVPVVCVLGLDQDSPGATAPDASDLRRRLAPGRRPGPTVRGPPVAARGRARRRRPPGGGA